MGRPRGRRGRRHGGWSPRLPSFNATVMGFTRLTTNSTTPSRLGSRSAEGQRCCKTAKMLISRRRQYRRIHAPSRPLAFYVRAPLQVGAVLDEIAEGRGVVQKDAVLSHFLVVGLERFEGFRLRNKLK